MTAIKVMFIVLTLTAVTLLLLTDAGKTAAKAKACNEATEYWRYTKKQHAVATDKSASAKTTINAFNKMHELCN